MQSDEDDPLRHADVGETKTVRESKYFHGINYEPRVFHGSDRQGRSEIVDVEIVQNEHGEHDFKVTWEGDLTKRLPRNWDQANEPLTAEQERRARRRKWLGRIVTAGVILLPFGIAILATDAFMHLFFGEVTVNGEPVEFSHDMLFLSLLVLLLSAAIVLGLQRFATTPTRRRYT